MAAKRKTGTRRTARNPTPARSGRAATPKAGRAAAKARASAGTKHSAKKKKSAARRQATGATTAPQKSLSAGRPKAVAKKTRKSKSSQKSKTVVAPAKRKRKRSAVGRPNRPVPIALLERERRVLSDDERLVETAVAPRPDAGPFKLAPPDIRTDAEPTPEPEPEPEVSTARSRWEADPPSSPDDAANDEGWKRDDSH